MNFSDSVTFNLWCSVLLCAIALLVFARQEGIRHQLKQAFPVGMSLVGFAVLTEVLAEYSHKGKASGYWFALAIGLTLIGTLATIIYVAKKLSGTLYKNLQAMLWGGEFDKQIFRQLSPENLFRRVETIAEEADRTACMCRNAYWFLKFVQLAIACLITAHFEFIDAVEPIYTIPSTTLSFIVGASSSTVMGAILVLLEAVQQTAQLHQQWVVYRMCKERIIGEWQLFVAGVSPYDSEDKSKRVPIICANIEGIVRDTNISWTKLESQNNAELGQLAGGQSTAKTSAVAEAVSNLKPKSLNFPKDKSDVPKNTTLSQDMASFYEQAFDILQNQALREKLNKFLSERKLSTSPTSFNLSTYDALDTDARTVIGTLKVGLVNMLKNQLLMLDDSDAQRAFLSPLDADNWSIILNKCEELNVMSGNASAFYRQLIKTVEAIQYSHTNLDPGEQMEVKSSIYSLTAGYIAALLKHFGTELTDYLN